MTYNTIFWNLGRTPRGLYLDACDIADMCRWDSSRLIYAVVQR